MPIRSRKEEGRVFMVWHAWLAWPGLPGRQRWTILFAPQPQWRVCTMPKPSPRGYQKGKLYRTSQAYNWCLGHGFGRWASVRPATWRALGVSFLWAAPIWSPGETRRHRLLVVFQSAKRETLVNPQSTFLWLDAALIRTPLSTLDAATKPCRASVQRDGTF